MFGLSVNLLLTIMGRLPIINEDQMPLHRNESSTQKTLNFVDMDAYVKENYNLSRERVTAFICIYTSFKQFRYQPKSRIRLQRKRNKN